MLMNTCYLTSNSESVVSLYDMNTHQCLGTISRTKASKQFEALPFRASKQLLMASMGSAYLPDPIDPNREKEYLAPLLFSEALDDLLGEEYAFAYSSDPSLTGCMEHILFIHYQDLNKHPTAMESSFYFGAEILFNQTIASADELAIDSIAWICIRSHNRNVSNDIKRQLPFSLLIREWSKDEGIQDYAFGKISPISWYIKKGEQKID
jgi:hypothetical protein